MSEIIDIEIVVDTANLIAQVKNPSTNPQNPTGIGHNFAYMIAANDYVKSGQASGDLSISADVGDTIRWRMISLSGNTGYSASLQNIQRFANDQITSPTKGELIEPQSPVPGTTAGPIALPPTFTTATDYDFFLTADVVKAGTENYNVSFVVQRYHAGALQVLGYFVWDPVLTAS